MAAREPADATEVLMAACWAWVTRHYPGARPDEVRILFNFAGAKQEARLPMHCQPPNAQRPDPTTKGE